eukprot:6443621-Alexandrium_andersonii.AAC.1
MRACTLLSRRRCPSQGCAPSFGAAFKALVPLRPAGRRRARRLESFGFAKGRASACCFYNAELDVR